MDSDPKAGTEERGRAVSKLLFFAALIALVAIMACGGDDPTEAPESTPASEPTAAPTAAPVAPATPRAEPTQAPAPTDTQAPAPTDAPVPTATTAPTAAPAPTATAAPMATPVSTAEPAPTEAMASSNVIRPLKLEDPLSIASELSEAELGCTAGVAPIERLLQIFDAPETGTPEELSQLFGCFEDETVLRMFLTQLIGLSGPLSEESSQCVRTGLAGMDVRSVMLSGSRGDPATAMVGSMSALFLTVSCLNDDEFATSAPALGFNPDDREGLNCLMEAMGGPEGFAASVAPGNQDAILALFGAAAQCGLEMEGAPGMMGGPSEVLPPTTGTEPGPGEGVDRQMDALAGVFAGLSDSELACIAGVGISPEMLQDPSVVDSATPEQQGQVLGCLENETVTSLFLSGFVGNPSQLSDETSACIRTGMEGIDLRSVMLAGSAGDEEAAMVGGMSAMLLTVSCMNDEEFAVSAPALGFNPDDREGLDCVMEQLGGPEGFAATLAPGDQSGIFALLTAAAQCGLEMQGAAPTS